MSHITAIPRTYAGQLYMGYKFFKWYDKLMEYAHNILILRQPEIHINIIFYHNGVQIELTWRLVNVTYGVFLLYS